MEKCPVEEGKTVKALVAQLCERFYYQGWATGTGGGVSIRVGGPSEGRPYRVFVAPSGERELTTETFHLVNVFCAALRMKTIFSICRRAKRGYGG